MQIEFLGEAFKQIEWMKRSEPALFRKVVTLIEDIKRDPYAGLGKPEPLKHDYSGWWSRRISDEHRLVYRIEHDTLFILQCRYHYQ